MSKIFHTNADNVRTWFRIKGAGVDGINVNDAERLFFQNTALDFT